MLRWAGSMKWKGLNPVVKITEKVYKKGVTLSKTLMRPVEKFLKRNASLPKYDILIDSQMGI